MSTLDDVSRVLADAGVRFAVIGASAMAVRGVVRSTLDVDLLTTDRRVLRRDLWDSLRASGCEVEIRFGDASDPLVGIAVISAEDERPVDVIVGEAPWQARIIDEASSAVVQGSTVFVASLVGVVLLKLYAGGPQDRWDIEQLLTAADTRDAVEREVSRRLDDLPQRARRTWEELAGG